VIQCLAMSGAFMLRISQLTSDLLTQPQKLYDHSASTEIWSPITLVLWTRKSVDHFVGIQPAAGATAVQIGADSDGVPR